MWLLLLRSWYSSPQVKHHPGRGGGGDFIPSLLGCVYSKVMDMGPFLASSE